MYPDQRRSPRASLLWTKLTSSLGSIDPLKLLSEAVQSEHRDGKDIYAPEDWAGARRNGTKRYRGKLCSFEPKGDTTDLAPHAIRPTIQAGGGSPSAVPPRAASPASVAVLWKPSIMSRTRRSGRPDVSRSGHS
ncbi:hypothetical protein MCOR04_005747 [Pyricularia oryzae]|nr:hypothetical protein MCOR09_005675 [Pyricularia oryzae]KAI6580387.1 hypothetical protein MCOR04_005747 [Pyricularia oryzae]